MLYDVTTLYFEAENEDSLRKVGYSKERRVDPQIVVGLLVDRWGFPGSSQSSVEGGSETAGVEYCPSDVVGQVTEPESGPAEVLEPSV
ncbi:hypothetical protein KJY99_11715, partial [Cutibacterium avidum]|nr:hypothetical protein [Cutibacterium avidum]